MSEVDYGKGWALSAIWEFRKFSRWSYVPQSIPITSSTARFKLLSRLFVHPRSRAAGYSIKIRSCYISITGSIDCISVDHSPFLSNLREGRAGHDPGDNDHRQGAQALQASRGVSRRSSSSACTFQDAKIPSHKEYLFTP